MTRPAAWPLSGNAPCATKFPPCKARATRDGKKAGRKDYNKGLHTVLERLLAKRFGSLSAETRQRLTQATPEQLETWAEHLLDAPTLSAVFESH